jgi:hypothetical protein
MLDVEHDRVEDVVDCPADGSRLRANVLHSAVVGGLGRLRRVAPLLKAE